MKIGVLLSGCGVYDGSEIQEAVLTLLMLDRLGIEAVCTAPNITQYHTVNHLTGETMPENRNVLTEAARIARGKIIPLSELNPQDLQGLAIPGGFGAAKNLSSWAFEGATAQILPDVKNLIVEMVKTGKPIAALCIAPNLIGKALQNSGITATITVGSPISASPYNIEGTHQELEKTGVKTVPCEIDEIVFDDVNNIITTPCYMMEVSIKDVYSGIEKAITKLVELATLETED